ncbi:uncharacterized protein L199_004444 [Kwoniella botswanensis]|uniref:uncharacterized protein n=1 Tax=Kwoniella botswanensis TaxID=1268659 RepID=UPI00315DB85C
MVHIAQINWTQKRVHPFHLFLPFYTMTIRTYFTMINLPGALLGLVFLPAVPGHVQEKPTFWLHRGISILPGLGWHSWVEHRRHTPLIALYNSVVLVTVIALAVLPLCQNLGGHFALYYLSGAGANIAGLYFAWINEVSESDASSETPLLLCQSRICGTDDEKRALILAMSSDASFVLKSIVPNFIRKHVDYHKATKGLWFTAGLSIFLMFIIASVRYLYDRDKVLANLDTNVNKDQEFESPGVIENYDDLDVKR